MEKPNRVKIPTAALLLTEGMLPWTAISWTPGGDTVYVKGFGAPERRHAGDGGGKPKGGPP